MHFEISDTYHRCQFGQDKVQGEPILGCKLLRVNDSTMRAITLVKKRIERARIDKQEVTFYESTHRLFENCPSTGFRLHLQVRVECFLSSERPLIPGSRKAK